MEIKILNKLFNADLVGLYNIARVGENSPGRVDSSDYQICNNLAAF